MSKVSNIIIFLIFVVVFFSIFYYIISSVRKVRRAVTSYALSRGLVAAQKDESDDFGKMLEKRLGVPAGGMYDDVMRLPISVGEGYLYNGYKGIESRSKKGDRDEDLKYFITVFIDIPISGLVFMLPHSEIKGKLLNKMFDYAMSMIPGPGGRRALDIKEHFPEFAKTHTIFSEDQDGVFNVILTADVISTLMTRLPSISHNISFLPGGFTIEITPLFKRSGEVEDFVRLAEDLARYISEEEVF